LLNVVNVNLTLIFQATFYAYIAKDFKLDIGCATTFLCKYL